MRASPTKETVERIEEGEMYRASGDCVCPTCGKLYYDHAHLTDYEWLTILCDGSLVKL